MRSCGDSCSRAVRSTDSFESVRRSHVKRNLRPAVTRTPNSHTITPPERISGVAGYLGSYFLYLINGYVPGVIAPDGEELDAYLLGVDQPVECAEGVVVAVMHRRDDDDDKLVVVPEGVTLDDAEIVSAVAFQEQFFASELLRC